MSSGAGMNGRPLTVGSLFSGIGGFDLGFERAGMSTRWFCEQDEFCTRVLNKHWPDVPVYPDVTELKGADVEPVDVLCGGFPCQDLSLAGKGAGLAGERSGLWSEYARLVGELRPSYVVVENVAALLGRGLGSVLGDLSALGYDAEWDCIPASAVGAPHQRDRLWIVAYPNADRGGLEVVAERDGGATESELEAPLGRDEDGFRDDVADPAGVVGQRVLGAGGSGGEPEEPARDSGRDRGARAVGDSYGLVGAATERSVGRSGEVEEPGAFKRAVGSGGVRGEVQDSDGGSLLPWRVGGRVAQAGGSEWWAVEPPVGRVAHGVPDRLARLSALGNALVPQIAEWIGRRIVAYETERIGVAA